MSNPKPLVDLEDLKLEKQITSKIKELENWINNPANKWHRRLQWREIGQVRALKWVLEIVDAERITIKQRIKSACKFYLRYKDNPELLLKEYPKYKSEFVIKCLTLCLPKERIWLKDGTIADKNKYNEWLFKLAFKAVLEGDK